MNYDLAKELKEAGFPQQLHDERTLLPTGDGETGTFADGCYAPTLSELIEVCGNNLDELRNHGDDPLIAKSAKWEAHTDGYCMVGPTPEIAVSHLWLALQKKPHSDGD